MQRRTFFSTGLLATAAAQVPDLGKSKMKITSVRLVNPRPKRPVPSYTPAAGSWSTQAVEVANPMSIYPRYKATRSLFFPDAGRNISGKVRNGFGAWNLWPVTAPASGSGMGITCKATRGKKSASAGDKRC